MNKKKTNKMGFNDKFVFESNLYPNLYVGRILSQYKDLYKVVCEDIELLAEISGKFRSETRDLSDYPAVGDFVMLDRNSNTNGNAIIHNVLSRKSAFIRKAAGSSNDNQVVASNIDTVFICMSLNNDFNLRRIERYLSISWNSGATPVIILTKADLCDDVENKLLDVNSVALGVDVLVTSTLTTDGYLQVMNYIIENQTVAFIGSSGVGKSTLINCLLQKNELETSGIRNDDKGRHTTTIRELFVLENGAMVIDTPGMRELGVESVNLSKTFTDIDELAMQCKFKDCSHTKEPGCAIQRAIIEGDLSFERFSNYKKLEREAGYEGLNSKQIEHAKINEMFKDVGGIKNARKFTKKQKRNKY